MSCLLLYRLDFHLPQFLYFRSEMNLNTVVTLCGEVSSLKNALLALPRIKNGPLTAKSKREVERLVRRFQQRVQTLGITDANLQVVIAGILILATDLADCASNNDGGYLRVEQLFAETVSRLGWVDGYLFAFCHLYDQKRRYNVDLNTQFA